MSIDEIFPNPTVKNVVFQIRYPNLFSMESKIGDLQSRIIKEFPESSLIFRRQILFADVGAGGKLENIPGDIEQEAGSKIWEFKSDKNYKLNVLTNSLDISSQYHKTYNFEGGNKFRDIIEFVLEHFFEVTSIPLIKRIGLRYDDICPITAKDDSTFQEYYNSIFPFNRFNIPDTTMMEFRATIKKNEYNLLYYESLQKIDEEYKLLLTFDGFAENIASENCLEVTDALHEMISDEYVATINEPVYEYMRQEEESENGA